MFAPAQQQQRAFLRRQFLDFDAGGDHTCRLITRREQDISIMAGGQELPGHGQIVGIVQDEQPALVSGQPALDSSHDLSLILLVFFGQGEQLRQLHEVSVKGLLGGSPHPKHVGILVTIAKSVFGCGLRFADAAESIEGLRLGQRSHSGGREPLVEQCQELVRAR